VERDQFVYNTYQVHFDEHPLMYSTLDKLRLTLLTITSKAIWTLKHIEVVPSMTSFAAKPFPPTKPKLHPQLYCPPILREATTQPHKLSDHGLQRIFSQ
jgi:hypothetical protein